MAQTTIIITIITRDRTSSEGKQRTVVDLGLTKGLVAQIIWLGPSTKIIVKIEEEAVKGEE